MGRILASNGRQAAGGSPIGRGLRLAGGGAGRPGGGDERGDGK